MTITMSKKLISLILSLVIAIIVHTQCVERNILTSRIAYLRDTSAIPIKDKIAELNSYLVGINRCPYYNDSTHAYLLRTTGMFYRFQGDYLNAIKYFRNSIDLIRKNSAKPSVTRKPLLTGYFWLSTFYDSVNNVPEKMKAINDCIETAKELNSFSDLSCVRSLYAKTEYYFNLGDYNRCVDYAKLCEKFAWECAKVNSRNPPYYSSAVEHALSSFGWSIEALLRLKNFNAAEQILHDKLFEYRKLGQKNYDGMIYDDLADVEVSKGNYQKALSFFQQSFRFYKKSGNDFNCKQVLSSIGYDIFFSRFRDYKTALRYYHDALGYVNRDRLVIAKDSIESLSILNRIANVYVETHAFDSAFKYFQLAFNQIKPGLDEIGLLNDSKGKIKEYKKLEYISSLLMDKADAYKKQSAIMGEARFLTKAIKVYKIADQFLDTIKNLVSDLKSKLFWRSAARRLYENAIQACYLQNNTADAFYFFEKSRAVLLNDQIIVQKWLGEKLILKLTQVEKKIAYLERELTNTDKSSEVRSELDDELLGNKQEYERLQDLIRTNNPFYYQSFIEKNFVSIHDMRKTLLKDHQAIVELFNGDSAEYILILTLQNSSLEKISKKTFDSLSATFTKYMSHHETLNANFTSYVKCASQLYQLMFKNLPLPQGRIIISPDGKYIPFEALLTSTRPLTYFLDDHAVSYTYSARYLLNNFTKDPAFKSNIFMGFAPVQYAAALPELAGSDESLQRMGTYFANTTNFIRKNASKNNFLNEYYKYRIIQLYTHATDSGTVGEPMIYFSDSALSLSDLFYEGKPSTSLVVLSACETANGKLYNGEGVFSFSRQFAALGIPTSVSNLWKIDNQSTYKITELFYKYLSRGLPSDVALQQAKMEFRKTVSSKDQDLPYYWAASVLIGPSNAVISEKHFQWGWLVLSGAGLFLSLFIWKTFRKKVRYTPIVTPTPDTKEIAASTDSPLHSRP